MADLLLVPVAKQLALMYSFISDIGKIRYRMFHARSVVLLQQFNALIGTFGANGRDLMGSPEMFQRIRKLLGEEAAYVVLSTGQEHVRLSHEWRQLIAGITGMLDSWAVSPFIVATIEHRLLLFALEQEKFRADLLAVTLRIGPVVLQRVGATVYKGEYEQAEQELLGLLVEIDAVADEIVAEHYPVIGAT